MVARHERRPVRNDNCADNQASPRDSVATAALGGWLAEGRVTLGDLQRSPEDRERRLQVVPLLMLRDGDAVLTPDDETVLAGDDELLFAGHGSERRELESTLVVDSTGAYVLFDQRIPSSWVWRKFSRKNPTPSTPDDRGSMTTHHR
jgi:voltage-gated potassium channel